ncbi:hypothetical protein [Salinicola aestuarinus]|uniref:hypothetical protein n=1 Tax=Salinicola aestuarinus TaxID=1949082 RepID=UPI000DA1F5C2|nr:hypothetical protein [Salinicola aestuarinus]
MKRHGVLFSAAVAGALLLVGCDSSDPEPLSFVPADTPYLFADLEVADDSTRDALLAQSNASLPRNVAMLRNAASDLEAENQTSLAGVLGVLADEIDGKNSYQDVMSDIGLALDQHSAIYGEGLIPVMRGGVEDAEQYRAFLDRLAAAADTPFQEATLDDADYRTAALGDSPFQLISRVDEGTAVLSIAPTELDDEALRRILGLTQPDESAESAGRLQALVDDKAYLPYALGYLDLQRIIALVAAGEDPMLRAAQAMDSSGDVEQLSSSCQADLDRLAARAPELSVGFTEIESDHMVQRTDLALAEDLTAALSEIQVALPGLGREKPAGPFDIAVALPMKELRDLMVAQTRYVRDNPFTCEALADLNAEADELANQANMLAMPPFGSLRGFRLVLDDLSADGPFGQAKGRGAAIVATDNPTGLLAVGQMAVPQLANVQLDADGKATALPDELGSLAGADGAWAAMTDSAIGVAVGKRENDRLESLLKAPTGDAGQLMNLHITGDMYGKWMGLIDAFEDGQDATSERYLESLQSETDRIDTMDISVRMTSDGLAFESRTDWNE